MVPWAMRLLRFLSFSHGPGDHATIFSRTQALLGDAWSRSSASYVLKRKHSPRREAHTSRPIHQCHPPCCSREFPTAVRLSYGDSILDTFPRSAALAPSPLCAQELDLSPFPPELGTNQGAIVARARSEFLSWRETLVQSPIPSWHWVRRRSWRSRCAQTVFGPSARFSLRRAPGSNSA